jgi:chromosome segregation ATPase
MQYRRRSPRLWLWTLVATSSFMAGAHLVARIQGNNARAGFTTGLLTGSMLVGTIATLHGYQAHKDYRHEAKDLRSRLNALSYELTQTQRLKDGLETRQQALQSQLTETTQQAQSATAALEPMQKRVVVAESAVAALNASEKSLIDRLRKAEARVQSLQSVATVYREEDFKRGRTYERRAAEQQVAKTQKEKSRAIAALEQQMAQAVAALETELAGAREEIQEWETEFETQLQHLGDEQEQAILARVVAEVRQDYEDRLKQVSQAIPKTVQKRCDKYREKWLAELQAELEAVTGERDRACQRLEHYEREFVGLAADVEQLNDTDLHQALQAQVESLQGALEQKNRTIEDYKAAIADLEAPRLFPGGYEHHRGNLLIRHAHGQGIILDALHRSRNTEAGQETYYFAARRPEPPREVSRQAQRAGPEASARAGFQEGRAV